MRTKFYYLMQWENHLKFQEYPSKSQVVFVFH